MDDSVEIHAPEETLGPQEKKSKSLDGSSHRKSKSESDKPATESHSSGIQSQVIRPSRSDGMSRTEAGTDWHHRRSMDKDRRKDRYSSDRGSSRHSSEWRRSSHRHSSDHRHLSSSSGHSSDRGWERNSTSRAATPTDSCHLDSTGQQGSLRWSRTEGRDSGSKAQPAASSLSRRGTTSCANPSNHPGSSQQAREWDWHGSMDLPVSPSMPTRRGSTTDWSRSSSSGEIHIVHVSKKYTDSVAPADVTSRADSQAEVANPAQLADSAQFADMVDTASPSEAADPARMADSAVEPEFTREEQPRWPGTAESAGPSGMDGPSRPQLAAHADQAGITDPLQDQSAVGSSSVSRPCLMPGFDH